LWPRRLLVLLSSKKPSSAGRRSADEMSHMWIGATYLSDEDFEFLKQQRELRIAQQQ